MRDQIDRLYRAINEGNLDVLDELFAEGYVDHTEGYRGVEAVKQQISAFRVAFPDLHVTVEDTVEDGDRIATRTTVTGTQTGDLMGIPATGKTVSVCAVDIARFDGGKVLERWGGLDMYALMRQLGVVPEPQTA
jgi:steroid delta-isomerase-like uncharacterized protein